MNEFLNFQRYLNQLGHFWQNFNNLEYFLREYLYRKNGGNASSASSLINQPLGTICDENKITDYSSFEELTNTFNSYQKKTTK